MLAHAPAFKQCLCLCQWAGGCWLWTEEFLAYEFGSPQPSLCLGLHWHKKHSLCGDSQRRISRHSPLTEAVHDSLPPRKPDIYTGHSQMSRRQNLAYSTDVLIYCFSLLFVPLFPSFDSNALIISFSVLGLQLMGTEARFGRTSVPFFLSTFFTCHDYILLRQEVNFVFSPASTFLK